jgi:hypothetical protein
MRDVLAGRLTWEQSPRGICVEIPVRRGPMVGLYGPLVIIWLSIATVRYWHVLTTPHPNDIEFTLQLVAMGIYILGFCFFVCWLVWIFTGDTLLFLDAVEMKIQRRVLGVDLSTRVLDTRQVSQLRYVGPRAIATYQGVTNPSTSRIQFRVSGALQSFARGVSEIEAQTLIERMLEVYKFPKSLDPDIDALAR